MVALGTLTSKGGPDMMQGETRPLNKEPQVWGAPWSPDQTAVLFLCVSSFLR